MTCNTKWAPLQPRYTAALAMPATDPTVIGHLADMKSAHATLLAKFQNLEFNPTNSALVDDLALKIQAVETDFTAFELAKKTFETENNKGNKLWFKIARDVRKNLKPPDPTLEPLMTTAEVEYAKVEEKVSANDYAGALAILNGAFDTACSGLYRAISARLAAKRACSDKFKLAIDVKHTTVMASTPELRTLAKTKDTALKAYDDLFKAFDFTEAEKRIPAAKEAVDKLIEASARQELAARPKTDAAKLKVTQLAADGSLEMRPTGELIELLTDLQGVTSKLTADERVAQRELYKAMPLSKEFMTKDTDRQKKVIEGLVSDPAEKNALKDHRTRWGALGESEKLATLVKAHAKQCSTLGIPTIPVLLVKKPPSNCGGFVPSARVINVNSENASFKVNFEDSLNTVFHETGHWFQLNLVERYNNGEAIADDEKEQVIMFALNDNRSDAYVQPGEDDETYRKQPQEAHAFKVGDDMGKMLTKALDA